MGDGGKLWNIFTEQNTAAERTCGWWKSEIHEAFSYLVENGASSNEDDYNSAKKKILKNEVTNKTKKKNMFLAHVHPMHPALCVISL